MAMGPAAPRPPPQTSILAQEQPQGYGMVETYRGPYKGPQGGAQLAGGCFRGEPPPFHGISQAGNSSKLMQPRRAAWAKRLIKCFWLAGGQRQSLFFLYSDKQSGEGRGRKEEWGGGGAHSQWGSLWTCHQLGEVGREGGTGACTHTRTHTQCAHAGGWGETKGGGDTHRVMMKPPRRPFAHQHGGDTAGGTGPAPGGVPVRQRGPRWGSAFAPVPTGPSPRPGCGGFGEVGAHGAPPCPPVPVGAWCFNCLAWLGGSFT